MVILKSEEQIFDDNNYKDWNWLFFNNKEADCILYSEDGHGFRIHKEILSQTEKMRNILSSFKENCCGTMEILCPCPKDELEQLVKFLYCGIISLNVDLFKILDNLITIFGFPENLTLYDENGKEFNRDEFLTEKLKREKGITGVHSETISIQTSIFENNENNVYTDSSILEDIEVESDAKRISKNYLESSKVSQERTILSKDYEKSPEIDRNVDVANFDHAKTVLTMNVFEKHETKLNLEANSNAEANFVIINDPIVIPFNTKKSLEHRICNTRSTKKESQINLTPPVHEEENPYQFEDLEKEFTTPIDEKKKSNLEKNRSFKCKICDASFEVKTNLKKHIALVHEGRKLTKCSICDATFKFKHNLKRHIDTVHEEKKPFKCNLCEFNGVTNKGLHSHETTVHLKPFECESCGVRFGREIYLKRHVVVVHEEKRPFQCIVCDAKFKLKQCLKRHTDAVHEGKKPYKCNFCEFYSASKQGIYDHEMRVHSKKKAFKCNVCDNSFSLKGQLKSHMTVHEEKKPFQCISCDAKFKWKPNLKRHTMLVHEGKKTHQM
jgi:hypothetical protein